MQDHCSNYALPSLCFSVLPVCRTPDVTNSNFRRALKERENNMKRRKRKNKGKTTTSAPSSTTTVATADYLYDLTIEPMAQVQGKDSQALNPTRNTENLRRICRTECELMENELCQKEYAIAKRHPTIGQKLNLETCTDLPMAGGDCLTLGITIDARPNETCYQDGLTYRGTRSVSASGRGCLRWSTVSKDISAFPELAGHNFCRYVCGHIWRGAAWRSIHPVFSL